MKKSLLFFGLVALVASCAQQAPTTTINGELSGLDAEDSLLVMCNGQKDTIGAPNGVFAYEYTDSVAGLVSFFELPKPLGNGRYEGMRMKPVSVMMFPGQSVNVKGDFDLYTVTGGKFYEEYNKFGETIAEAEAKKKSLTDEYMALAKSGQDVKPQLDSLFGEVKAVDSVRIASIEEYIASHLDSEVSLFLLYFNRPKSGEKYVKDFSDAVKNGSMKNFYEDLANYYETMAIKRQAAEFIQEGKPAPDFTLKDIEGNDFSLSSLKGKYVVLDFWGSWCGWCIKGMPEMKKVYDKYKGKLEIVGIDCNDTEEKWKAAVEKHGINWINVINSKEKGKDLTTIYNISGFPTKLIISPEGKIDKIVVGESPEFYDALHKFMK